MSASNVTVQEDERQAIILALALTSLLRPGWLDYCTSIARKFDGAVMFEDFRKYNADTIPNPPK